MAFRSPLRANSFLSKSDVGCRPFTYPRSYSRYCDSILIGIPAGTLKAAEWRVMITVYIPIALISIWGAGTIHDSLKITSHLHSVLDHTMLLVAVTSLACMQTMTASRAESYKDCITDYVHQI